MRSCLGDEHPLPFFIFFLALLLIPVVVNAQENVTDICQTCTEEICVKCIPKKITDYLNPNELLSSIISWLLKSSGLKQIPMISIQLLSFLIIVGFIWLFVSKLQMILYILVLALVMGIVVTIVLGYVGIIA